MGMEDVSCEYKLCICLCVLVCGAKQDLDYTLRTLLLGPHNLKGSLSEKMWLFRV